MTARPDRPAPGGGPRPHVLVLLSAERFAQLFEPATRDRLHAVADVTGPTGPQAPPAALSAADILLMSVAGTMDRRMLESAARLQWIASANAGPPRLDFAAVIERGIILTDSRRGFHRPVAEMALALYLALARDVVAHDRALHTPDGASGADGRRNQEASRRTLGLLGFRGIGQMLGRFLAPLEPRLLVHDPYVPATAIRAAGADAVELEELFRRSEMVFVLARPNAENRRLVSARLLDLLPPGGALIVVSRFWLVDETALIERLQAGRLRAGLDVFEEEPLAPGHALRSLPNAILTPHRAGGTLEGYWRIGRHFVDDVEHFAAGRPPSRMAIVDPRLAPQQEVHGV